jgi:sugar phosphate isomerase/epimerase
VEKGVGSVFVAASTDCFPDIPLPDVIAVLQDMEFSTVEIALHEGGCQMPPTRIDSEFDRAVELCRDTHRLDICSYSVGIDAQGTEYYELFKTVCRFAKATKVVILTVPSAELGTPFNEEIERLQRLVSIAETEGARVALRTQIGCLSEDPDTVMNLCDNVPGLGLTMDPSHYWVGPHRNKNLDKLMKYVLHVHLRDSKKDQLQVRVGQGEIEYAKLITQLERVHYDRALSIQMTPMEGMDMRQELRKLRLLLESSL